MNTRAMVRFLSDLIDPDDEVWQDRALCTQVDPDLYFPERGTPNTEAKRVCGRCDVREQCLKYALDHPEVSGVWGGTSDKERKQIRARKRAAERVPQLPVTADSVALLRDPTRVAAVLAGDINQAA